MSEILLYSDDSRSTESRQTEICPISVIVPCFNEGGTISALAEKLSEFNVKFFGKFDCHIILVDDGSSDSTHRELLEHFGGKPRFLIIRHNENRGIAAAIMTGIKAAQTEIVVSIDSDCTYDPLHIDRLIEKFDDQTSMVTASPYHPQGRVIGVPKWRLWLSQQASRKYRKAIGVPLHTFTSCFRAYRRSFFKDMELQDSGFVGIAEMLWLTIRRGGTVVEVPAELSTRKLGFSKLRTLPVIRKHLTLLRRIQRTPTVHAQSRTGQAR